uniref:Uncharacterized protein n=1 Tax=Peronospora matthiolae TaxID=2874970 RepID=A0AAV1TSD7_9STRA
MGKSCSRGSAYFPTLTTLTFDKKRLVCQALLLLRFSIAGNANDALVVKFKAKRRAGETRCDDVHYCERNKHVFSRIQMATDPEGKVAQEVALEPDGRPVPSLARKSERKSLRSIYPIR